jgi:uncharacterized membrane protein
MATEASPPQRSAQPGRPYPPPAVMEPFWPAQLTVLFAIAIQLLLPERLTAGPRWLVPGFEAALLIGLFIVTPNQIEDEHPRRRRIALGMTAFVSAANIYSLAALTHYLLHHNVSQGRALIGAGVLIWITNFLIFALWYEPLQWRPKFIDYLYVSLTNAMAFSPTDTMPLTSMAKIVMGIQSLVSLVTIGLIVSRAINIL